MTSSMQIPEGSVIITPTEVYKEVVGTHQAVQNLSAKVDAMASDLNRRVTELDGPEGEIRLLQKRVSSLERWRWLSTGAIGMLSSGATAAVYEVIAARR